MPELRQPPGKTGKTDGNKWAQSAAIGGMQLFNAVLSRFKPNRIGKKNSIFYRTNKRRPGMADASEKMWRKCGILCTRRYTGNDWEKMAKKIREPAVTLKILEFRQKNGGA